MIRFITRHAGDNVGALALRYHGKDLGFDLQFALTQIEARRKCRGKIPWFLSCPQFMFQSLQSSEQATNQNVALLHANLIGSGNTVADLTAGLGIDAMTIALNGNDVTAFELDAQRAGILRHNVSALGVASMQVMEGDSMEWLRNAGESMSFDWIFVDPARRDSHDRRCFRLQDSFPDVVSNEDLLLGHARNVLVKGSPLLDITQTLRDLRHVSHIYIISRRNECKEVLVRISPDCRAGAQGPMIQVMDIGDNNDAFPHGEASVTYSFECHVSELGASAAPTAVDSDIYPGAYIYEPGAGMRKLNCAGILCSRYDGMKTLGRNLFICGARHDSFPGRISMIHEDISSKQLKRMGRVGLRVVSDAYPLAAREIRSRYKLAEGEDTTLFATSMKNGKNILLLARSV